MSASFAGFMLWLAKLRYGSESAAASVLDVKVEDAEDDGGLMTVVAVLVGAPNAPEWLCDRPCPGDCCFRSWRAFARAFS